VPTKSIVLFCVLALASPAAASPKGKTRGTGGTEAGSAQTSDASIAVAAAQDAIGSPYASAGTTKEGFDCSGLTRWAFRKAGIKLPHSSYDQYEMGEKVERADVLPGDLVFFDTAGSGASHVGIATDARHAISATSSGGVMEHSTRKGYWGSHYIGARRVA
jgi:cell wall-associated NlpC family hydrolase